MKTLLEHAFKAGRISENTTFEEWYETFVNQNKKGMMPLSIYKFQAEQIEDTFRIVARTLDSKDKKTCLDRDVMVSWQMIKNVLSEKIDIHVSRL